MKFFTLPLTSGKNLAVPFNTIVGFSEGDEFGTITVEVRPDHLHRDWASTMHKVAETYSAFDERVSRAAIQEARGGF
jgi:hypothetical protein